MAALKGIKAPRKAKKRIRTPKMADEKYTGTEPVWDDIDSVEDPKHKSRLYDTLNYYNYYYKVKDLKKNIVKYVSEYSDMSKDEIKQVAHTNDAYIPITVGSLSTAALRGMPMKPEWHAYIIEKVRSAMDRMDQNNKEEEQEVKKPKKRVLTVQDRLKIRLDEILSKIEEIEDRVLYDGETRDPKIFEMFKVENVPQAQLSKVEETFRPRQAEFQELQSKDCDPELKEAYRHYSKADVRRILDFYKNLFDGLDLYRESKKVARKKRVKKAPTKAKLVERLKYKKEDAVYGLMSIDPTDIIGAKELWVFNTKTRKIGQFIAGELDGELSVKGSNIVGFDPEKSTTKTLRKPKDQLAEFKKSNKVALRKFMKNIRSVEIKLGQRINADTILLKVST